MEIAEILIILATILASAAVLIRPFTCPGTSSGEDPVPVLQHELEEVHKQLQELKNDPDASRFRAEELEERLAQLHDRIKSLDQRIAALIEQDPVERAVQHLYLENPVGEAKGTSSGAGMIPDRLCQQCGQPLDPGHRFCPSCGLPAGKDQR